MKIINKELKKPFVESCFLFGSIIKKEESPNSDIDIYVQVKNEIHKKIIQENIDRLNELCLERYGNRLSPYILTKKEYKSKKYLAVMFEIEKGLKII